MQATCSTVRRIGKVMPRCWVRVIVVPLLPSNTLAQPSDQDDSDDRVPSLPTVELVGQAPLPRGAYQSRDGWAVDCSAA